MYVGEGGGTGWWASHRSSISSASSAFDTSSNPFELSEKVTLTFGLPT